jgi:hypothetical protein
MRSHATLLGAGLLAVAASLTVGACASNDEPAASGPTTTELSSGSTAPRVPTSANASEPREVHHVSQTAASYTSSGIAASKSAARRISYPEPATARRTVSGASPRQVSCAGWVDRCPWSSA